MILATAGSKRLILRGERRSNRVLCLEGEGHSVAADVGANQGWLKLRVAYRTADPTTEQREKRTWFESGASNNDPKGLGNGRERD